MENLYKTEESNMISMPPEQYVDLVVCGFSFLLYLAVIYTILKDRQDPQLKSSFFILSATHASPDLVYYLFIHVNRARKYSYFPGVFESLPKPVPKMMFIFKFHLKFAQLFGIVMFSINRFSVFKPGSVFDAWWSPKGVIWLQLLQWILPLWVWIPGFLQNFDVHFAVLPESPAVRQVADADLYLIYFTIEAIGNTVASIASTIFYCLAMRKVAELTKKGGANQKFKAEYRMFLCAMTIFALLLIDTAYCVATVFYQAVGDYVTVKMLDNWWYPLTDFLSVVQPWTLMAASAVLRRRVLRRALCGAGWVPLSGTFIKSKTTVVPMTTDVRSIWKNSRLISVA